MDKAFSCGTCHKKFVNISNLRRHNEAFHSQNRTKYECWHCSKLYARIETARKHTIKVHGTTEHQPIQLKTKNKRWKPEIVKPGPWVPPPEARQRSGTVYKVTIRTGQTEESHISNINKIRRQSRLNTYIPLTVEEACVTLSDEPSTLGRLNRLQIEKDLELSPSSSSSTITQDEIEDETDRDMPLCNKVWGVFTTSTNSLKPF